MKRWDENKFAAQLNSHIVSYPTPINLNYFWSFGSIAGFCLAIQIITGIFLAMHYTPHIDYAFTSVEHIMRDVNHGWLLRYLHANGASMFFIAVYCHLFRGFYYGSYLEPRGLLWCSGVIIFLLMMATAFMGYVLPWGQMSFWGATVITNLFSAIPLAGGLIVEWLWGGFSVDNATLNRFFSLHYLLPFLILGLVISHLGILHENGSNNPLGNWKKAEPISFFPYFYVKDLLAFLVLVLIFSFFVFQAPNDLGHTDNYIRANSLVTPAHIVPEWYFLPFYAILKGIPHKVGGILAMFGSLLMLLMLPFLHVAEVQSPVFRSIHKAIAVLIMGTFLVLMWLGGKSDVTLHIRLATFFYFFLFLVCIPFSSLLDRYLAEKKFKVNSNR